MPRSAAPRCTERARPRAAPALIAGLALLLWGAPGFSADPPAASATGQSLIDTCHDPLCYTAEDATVERTHALFDHAEIVDTTRGITHITADKIEASGADLADSRWVLTGHVIATTPQGKLEADRATVQRAAKRISIMTAEGTPALFERFGPKGTVTAHGRSLSIHYDLENQHLELSGDSWITDDCGNEVSSQRIQYDIANQRVEASAGTDKDSRVHGTIHSRSPTPCVSGLGGR